MDCIERPGIEAGILDLTIPAVCSWFRDVLMDQIWSERVGLHGRLWRIHTPVLPSELPSNSLCLMLFHREVERTFSMT